MTDKTQLIKVSMSNSFKEIMKMRCAKLGISYSEYIRMLITLDINSCSLKNMQCKENELLESIDSIRDKLENY